GDDRRRVGRPAGRRPGRGRGRLLRARRPFAARDAGDHAHPPRLWRASAPGAPRSPDRGRAGRGRAEPGAVTDALSPRKRELLEGAPRRRRDAARLTIPRRTDRASAPLSFGQQRLWFLELWQPGAPTFNGARAFRIRGPLDHEALEQALARIVYRHQ